MVVKLAHNYSDEVEVQEQETGASLVEVSTNCVCYNDEIQLNIVSASFEKWRVLYNFLFFLSFYCHPTHFAKV